MPTVFATISIFSFIIAVGAIDGPSGYEFQENWWLCGVAILVGLTFAFLAILFQSREGR